MKSPDVLTRKRNRQLKRRLEQCNMAIAFVQRAFVVSISADGALTAIIRDNNLALEATGSKKGGGG